MTMPAEEIIQDTETVPNQVGILSSAVLPYPSEPAGSVLATFLLLSDDVTWRSLFASFVSLIY